MRIRTQNGRVHRATATVRDALGGPVLQVALSPESARDSERDGARAEEVWSARVMLGERSGAAGETTGEALRARPIVLTVDLVTEAGVRRLGPWVDEQAVAPALRTPDWAKGAVWYQVFPERFANGNPRNDPSGPGVTLLPWDAEWGSASLDEIEQARADGLGLMPRPAWAGAHGRGGAWSRVIYRRRFGGDLQGVEQRLAHLTDLGVDAVYLTPIFESASLHKYDAADFRHIDRALGSPGAWVAEDRPGAPGDPADAFDPAKWPRTEADDYFIGIFLPAARSAGLRVVLDGVWNHVGDEFWAFGDLRARGKDSAYAAWFDARFADERTPLPPHHAQQPLSPGELAAWQGWDERNGDLPEFRQTPEGDLVALPKAHVFAVTRRWMDPNGDGDPRDGIDGWRLDVAPDIGLPFWRDWRRHAKSINPEAVLIGEIWFTGRAFLDGSAFDGQMNYPFAFAVTRWSGGDPRFDSRSLAGALRRALVRPPVDLVQMNLLTSHDTERLASVMANPGRDYDQNARPWAGDRYRLGPVDETTRRRVLLAAAMQTFWVGAPMVFGGDEWGMIGADDPDNRRPIPWPDLPGSAGKFDAEIHSGMRALFRLRQDASLGPVLRFGSGALPETGDPDVVAVRRELNGHVVLAVLNRGPRTFDAGAIVPAGATPRGSTRGDAGASSGAVDPLSARWWATPGPRSEDQVPER